MIGKLSLSISLGFYVLQLSCFQLRATSNEDGSLMKVRLDAGGPVEQVVAVGGQRALRESPLDLPWLDAQQTSA